MNGQKAKALRMLARHSVTSGRPQLPPGGWRSQNWGTCTLPKEHSRHKYQFLKKRYSIIPIAHTLKRMHNSTQLVQAVEHHINAAPTKEK